MEKKGKKISVFWDRRARNYDGQVLSVYENAYRKTVKRSGKFLNEKDRVLEIGCGTGNITLPLASRVKEITAIDSSARMLAQARKKAEQEGKENIVFKHLSFEAFHSGKESYDVVTAFNVLLYMKNREEVLDQIYEMLKPGGMFLSATDCLGRNLSGDALKKFVRSHLGRMPYVAFETPVGLMRKVQKHGFLVLEIVNLHPNPPNIFIAAQKIEK